MSRSGFIHRRGARLSGTLLSADSFNRADSSSTLGSTDGAGWYDSAAWTPHIGTWGIISNTAYKATGAGTGYASREVGISDIDATVTLSTVTLNGSGLLFRYASASSYWAWESETSTTRLYHYDGLNFNNLGSTSACSNGDVLRVVANGDSIKCYKNGTLAVNVTDARSHGATRHGLWMFGTAGRFDDWSVSIA